MNLVNLANIQAYLPQIILTAITLLIAAVARILVNKLIHSYTRHNTRFTIKVRHITRVCSILINSIGFIMLIFIWGVDTRNLFVSLSSIFAVIGVAMFAQWSILSNVTAGLVLFFSSPFRVGDLIRIQDKDFPIEARIEDIQTLYTYLRTKENELYVVPNNLLLQKAITVISGK